MNVRVKRSETVGAEAAQLGQLPRVGAELLRTVGGEAVELARPGDRGRMAGMERDVGLLERAQRERRAERELIRDDERRAHVGDDLAEALRHRCGLPQQVSLPRLRLQAKRRDHPAAGRGEEGAEVGRLVRLRRLPGETRVARRPEHELAVLEAVAAHPAGESRSGRDHHVVTAPRERLPERRERQVVRGVVGTDEEDSHAASSRRSASASST